MRKLLISLITAFILSLSFLFIAPEVTHACDCPDLNFAIERSQNIFLGYALEVQQPNENTYNVKFSVPIVFKGNANPIEWATTYDASQGNCGAGPVKVGDEFVLMTRVASTSSYLPQFTICNTTSLEKAFALLGPGKYVGSVCPQCENKIPPDIQQRALRYPHEFRDWGKSGGAPFYSWNTWLSLQNPNQAYSPLFNSAVWKSGCY